MVIWFYSMMPFWGQNVPAAKSLAGRPAEIRQAKVGKKVGGASVSHKLAMLEHEIPTGRIQLAPMHWTSILSADSTTAIEPSPLSHIAASSFAEDPIKTERKNVTLNLSSTPIESVIGILSKQSGVNIVLMTKSDQKVTINVKDMSLNEALKHLAMLASLRTLTVNKTIVMADDTTLKSAYPKEYEAEYGSVPKTDPEPPKPTPVADDIQRVYTLKFQGGVQLANALKEYLKEKKVNIVALPNTTIPNLGNSGSGLSGGSTGSSSANQTTEPRAKRVLLSGPADAVAEAMSVIEQMDIPRKQVEITVTIHDVSNDALKDAGFTWDFGQSTISEKVSGNMNFGTFSRNGLSFVNTIHALEQANKAKLLASPNVSVMDGELGSILIGEKRRFPVVTGTNSNGQFIYSTEEQNVGIYLLVASDVSEDGTVTLAVNAQVSSILGFLQLNGGSYPQISTRESKSTLILKDGQTMIMGGLLRDEEIVNFQKVPLLSQVPFFGELFKSRKTQKNSSQLLISITPRVITQK